MFSLVGDLVQAPEEIVHGYSFSLSPKWLPDQHSDFWGPIWPVARLMNF